MEEDKIRYQITDAYGRDACPVDWNKLPDELIDNIKSESVYNTLAYSTENKINVKSVIYFRPVKKFRKNITEYDGENNIVFGI
jgi:hypothetical protein